MMAAALCVPDETSSGISGFKQAFAEAKKATASLLDQIRLRFSVAGVADWITSLSFARAIFKLQQRTRSCLSRARAVVRPWYAYAGLACLGLALGALLLGVLWRNSASVSGVGGTKLLNEPANQPATVSNAEGHESSSVERRPRVRNQNGTDGLEGKSSSVARHEPPLPAGNSFGDATGADDTVIIRNSGLGSAGTPKPTSLQAIANAATVRNFLEKPIPLGALGNVPQPRDLLGVLSANPPPLPRLAPPSQRLRASEVIEGQAISLPLPLYPEEARRRGVQGSVFVRNVIDINGRIKHVAVLEGDPVLVQPAIDAVKQWRYAPTYLNRIPVETESIDELKFAVTDKAPEVSAPLHLPKDLKRGRLISQSMPVYPEAARRLRLDGTVVVQAIVGADGTIRQLRQVSGSHVLGQAALQALKKWRYEPSYMDGKPIEVNTTIVVNFKDH
jgi:TonB family protein